MAKGTKDRRPVPDLQIPEVTETLWDSASTYAQIDSSKVILYGFPVPYIYKAS